MVSAQQAAPQPQAPITAPPAPAAPASPSSAPPSPAPPSPAIAGWQQALVTRLARLQRYPAQANGAAGVVSLGFNIDRQGHVVSSRIVKSSGSTVLDAEALALIKRASPFPPPPVTIADADLTFVVPIRFAGASGQ
jgi:protein TonB